jgi:hypothetical protein
MRKIKRVILVRKLKKMMNDLEDEEGDGCTENEEYDEL